MAYGGSGYNASLNPSESVYTIVAANKPTLATYDVRIRLVRGLQDGTPDDNPELKSFLDAQGIYNEYENGRTQHRARLGRLLPQQRGRGPGFPSGVFYGQPRP